MKLTEQLVQALEVAYKAQAEVDRIVAEIEARSDGRRNRRKPRKRRAKPKAE